MTSMTGEGVSIEPITRQNVLAFKAVRLCALQDAPTAFSSTYASESRSTDEGLAAARRPLESATAQGRSWRGTPIYRAASWARSWIATILGEPTWLRCGWLPRIAARALGGHWVHAVLDWARSKNAEAVYLMVTSNNDTAITFYRSLRFSFTGGTELYRNDPELFEQEMSRPIQI